MQSRREWAHSLSALGAGGLILSLWLPWYELRLPGELINRAEQIANQLGVLGPLVHRAAEIARGLGPLHGDAWKVFTQTDIALLALGIVAGGLALLAYTGRAAALPAMIGGAGGVAGALTLYRLLNPPGPDGLLHPLVGPYVALASAALIVTGALLVREGSAVSYAAPLGASAGALGERLGEAPGSVAVSSVPPPGA